MGKKSTFNLWIYYDKKIHQNEGKREMPTWLMSVDIAGADILR